MVSSEEIVTSYPWYQNGMCPPRTESSLVVGSNNRSSAAGSITSLNGGLKAVGGDIFRVGNRFEDA